MGVAVIAVRVLASILMLGFCGLSNSTDNVAGGDPSRSAGVAKQDETGTAPETAIRIDPAHGDVRVDWVGPLEIREIDKQSAPGIDWATVIASLLAAGVGAGGALLVGWWSQRGIRDSLAQSANAAELKEIQAKLDIFYGPYRQRSEVNKLLATEFKSRQADPDFRTLKLLLKKDWQGLVQSQTKRSLARSSQMTSRSTD